MAACGILIGVLATYLLKAVLHLRVPVLEFSVTAGWVAAAVCIAFIGALLGALYPALKAAAKDPIEALAYE